MNIPAFLVYCAIIAVTPGPNTLMSLYLGVSGGSRFWRFFAGISGRTFWHRRDGEWQRKTFRQRFPEWKQCTGK